MQVYNIDKPVGWSSFDVVKFVRGRLRERKAGHLGTLDPFASGVLPVFLGKATRLIPYFNHVDKTYVATLRLGQRTDTFDSEGQVIAECDPSGLSEAVIREAGAQFVGTLQQLAPIYSAVKIDGQPSYKRARQGQEVERKSREVTVHELQIQQVEGPEVTFQVHCSAGTYIRTIADDWGQQLGVGAHLVRLRRVACGPWFTEANAVDVEALRNQPESVPALHPVDLLTDLLTVPVEGPDLVALSRGQTVSMPLETLPQPLNPEGVREVRAKAIDSVQNLIAVGRLMWDDACCSFQPERVFFQEN